MTERFQDRLQEAERRWRRGFGRDITDPLKRRQSMWHYNWLDHAILRRFWTNQHELAPGVWRSNQPTLRRLRRLRDRHGLKTVVNLRGEDKFAHYLFHKENCERLGLELVDVKLHATSASNAKSYLHLIEVLRTAKRPMLLHCKSGADRTGIVSALYLMLHHGVPLEEARQQLHWSFQHFRNSRAGVLDAILDLYAARQAETGIDIETWFATEYDPAVATAAFKAERNARRSR